ncbi:MAG TPA: response regulator [Burkholderiaceae bacterium]|nr:response regulator [Burkholderiaceae bacterium]
MNDPSPVILVIEDDRRIRRVLSTSLAAYGYEVIAAESGRVGLKLAAKHRPELTILDLGLPDVDGLDLIGKLRSVATQEILVLSARGTEEVKVRALDLGADDYLTKPFELFELLARVRVALRRSRQDTKPEQSVELKSAGVTIDLTRRRVMRGGQAIHLTPIEFRLIATLVKYAGKILTHEQLLTEVWGQGHEGNTQYLRIYLGGLRKKLEVNPAQPKFLLTVPGVGYRLALDG